MFTLADHAFWALETLAFAALLVAIVRSRSSRRWYSLVAYSTAQLVFNSALAILYAFQSWKAYFYTQWPSEILLCLLKLVILWQLVLEAIASVSMVPRAVRSWFVSAISLVGVGAWCFGFHGSFHWLKGANDLPALALQFDRATNMAVVAVLSTFAVFSSVFALKWKPRALRVDIGLVVISVVDLLCFLAETEFGVNVAIAYRVQSALHLLSISTWILAFAAPGEQARSSELGAAVWDLVPVPRRQHPKEDVYENA